MKLKLVKADNNLLQKKLEEFDFADSSIDPIKLCDHLIETMKAERGLGLSANQVGLPYRVFVMDSAPAICCFNPKVVRESDEKIYMEEGCLSYKGLYVKIKRSKSILVEYYDPVGEKVTREFDGISARCFLHELDHMNGVNFLQRANEIHRKKALSRWKKDIKTIKKMKANVKKQKTQKVSEPSEFFTYDTE